MIKPIVVWVSDVCISFAHAPMVFLFSTQTIEFRGLRKIRLHWLTVGLAPCVPTSRSRYRNDKRQNSVSLSFSRSKTLSLPPPCLFWRFVTWLMPCWQLSATGVKQLHATVSHFPPSSPGSKIKFLVMRIKTYSKIWVWKKETIKHRKPGSRSSCKRTQVKHRGCHKNGIITAALCHRNDSPPNLPNKKNVAEEWIDFVFWIFASTASVWLHRAASRVSDWAC